MAQRLQFLSLRHQPLVVGVALATAAFSAPTMSTSLAWGETYDVGPGQDYENIADVPLGGLSAGDVVQIHWRAEPYREQFGIDVPGTADAPIIIRGVASEGGALPAIDGAGASGAYGSHPRGLIHVVGDAAYVVVENLELRGANESNGFPDNAAGVFAPGGEHLTFRNLEIHDNGNGFFTWVDSSDVLVEGCLIYDNGNVDSLYEHNIYTESDGITFQLNRILPLRSGAGGNNLKDRSNGAVIRYNWIEGGNRALDLVDSEDGDWDHSEPDFVYGNVLIKLEDTGQAQVVHFGGDNESRPDRQQLYFYHNTVHSERADLTTLFFLNAAARAGVMNNIFSSPNAPLELGDPDDFDSAIYELGVNLFTSGWRTNTAASVSNVETQLAETELGLSGAPEDFTLSLGSPAVDRGQALSGVEAHPVELEFAGRGVSNDRADEGAPDLGPFASGSTGAGAEPEMGANMASSDAGMGSTDPASDDSETDPLPEGGDDGTGAQEEEPVAQGDDPMESPEEGAVTGQQPDGAAPGEGETGAVETSDESPEVLRDGGAREEDASPASSDNCACSQVGSSHRSGAGGAWVVLAAVVAAACRRNRAVT